MVTAQLLRNQLFQEFGQHPQAKWDQIQVKESRPQGFTDLHPSSPPPPPERRDVVLPPNSQVDQDPVPLSRLIRFALDLPLAQSVYHRKTGTFLHRDELVSWAKELKQEMAIVSELNDADAADTMALLKTLYSDENQDGLPITRLGRPRSLRSLVHSRQLTYPDHPVTIYPQEIRKVVEADLAQTLHSLIPRLDTIAALSGAGDNGELLVNLTESCVRMTDALDFWATRSHLDVTGHSVGLLLDVQKKQEHEETAALIESIQRATKDRDREEGHLIQALYTDVESMARTDLTNLQKVSAMWTPQVTTEVASLVSRTQELEKTARLCRTKLNASCELLTALVKQVEDNSNLIDRLLK